MRIHKAVLVATLAFATSAAMAEDAVVPAHFGLELNALTTVDGGCRVTFLAANRLGVDLDRAAVEVALFGTTGAIERLVSLEFKGMVAGKSKVLQFDLAGLQCASLSRVLVNDVVACDGAGLDPRTCLARLELTTRTDLEFGL